MAKSIDHYVLLTDDLPAARDQYLKLGFNVLPIEKHIEFGSANAVVIFPNTYLELLDLGDSPPWLADSYRPRLAAGPGLCHVSLTADSLSNEATRLSSLGYDPDPPMNARRKVRMPDGLQDETDSSSMYNWQTDRPFLSLFFSEHRKPETIFIDGHTHHTNGVQDTAGIVCVSDNPAADLTYYQDSAAGLADQVTESGFRLRGFRGDTIEVLTPNAIRDRYAPLLNDLSLGGLGGFPVALHLSVRDLAETEAFLNAADADFAQMGDHLVLPMEMGNGCLLVFAPAA